MKFMKREMNGADESPRTGERLQKILAQAGIASRRAAEQIILDGRVQVNGQTVTELGTKADLSRDHVRVDGKLLLQLLMRLLTQIHRALMVAASVRRSFVAGRLAR